MIVSRWAGTCFGVEAAIALARREKKPILGPLVHNPLVVDELAREGIPILDRSLDVDSLVAQGIREVVITAHGSPRELKERLTAAGIRYHDATCPVLLRSVYRKIVDLEAAGSTVILLGNPNHAEILASKSYGHGVLVVYSVEDVDRLPVEANEPVALCQTTMTGERLKELSDLIRTRKYPGLKVVDTRCKPVKSQQSAVEELSREVDAVLVVGGLQSSNTGNLARIAARHLPGRTHTIDRPEHVDPAWLDGVHRLGIAAGTSTPKAQIVNVVERIVSISSHPVSVRWDDHQRSTELDQ